MGGNFRLVGKKFDLVISQQKSVATQISIHHQREEFHPNPKTTVLGAFCLFKKSRVLFASICKLYIFESAAIASAAGTILIKSRTSHILGMIFIRLINMSLEYLCLFFGMNNNYIRINAPKIKRF